MVKCSMGKIKVALVFGGKSGEHEVSIRSADSIRVNLDSDKYVVVDVKIEKTGEFDLEKIQKSDVVFPIVHGSFGEDGCLQGLLEMYDKAYVGAGVLGSAIGMDKDVQKRLLREAGIKIANYVVMRGKQEVKRQLPRIKKLGWPVFVKPANMGSSVGVSRAENLTELDEGIEKAFLFDTKVIVEECVRGRELECAVLGNAGLGRTLIVGRIGEVIPQNHEFYDYEAKYIDEHGACLVIPAKLTIEKEREVQKVAKKTYSVLECNGLARVDFFLRVDGEIVVNEINTLPGFTSISMYPKLMGEVGVSYPNLLDRLIGLAIAAKKEKDKLERSYLGIAK